MGTIYRVRHRLLDEIRVIKVMQPHVVGDAEMRRRFQEEARTATRLKHPHLCVLYDFALDSDGTAYLVMEYIEGVNLADFLKAKGTPGIPTALEIAHQALLALGYLHRKGVVHRDVAPDNLMLSTDEEGRLFVKVIDLGIAKEMDRTADLTASGVFLGKLRYASPEQYGTLAPGQKLDGRSDLYGLGIVLYELLTNIRPFPGESAAELLRAHLMSTPVPFTESDPEGKVPPELRSIVMKALEKNRDDRFASAEEMDREIAVLRPRLSRPGDLDQTRTMLAGVDSSAGSGSGVTPSAQDRLDRQFADHTTPHPTPSRATAVPPRATAASEHEKTTAAPSAIPPDQRDTAPLGRPPGRRAGILIGLLGIAILGATLFLWFPVLRRGARPRTAALPPAPAAATPDASTAANPVAVPAAAPTVPAVEPTAGPTAAPEPARSAEPSPPAAAEPAPPASLDAARSAALRARADAERARAPELAGDVWRRARAKTSDADALASRGRFSDAQAAWDSAARLFAQARSAADRESDRRDAVSAHAPTPAPPAPPTAPPATARPEATRIAAALPTPIPTAAPAAAAAPPARAANPAEEKIREVVHRYEVAQNTLDADLYSRLFPSVDHARIAGAFESLRAQTVEFEVRRIQIDPTGARADVSGYEKRVAQPRAGTELRSAGDRVIHLERRGDTWVIVGLE
jgi:serine/threonine-protein kinase